MNSDYFSKALMVEHPLKQSLSMFSNGDFVIDSILVVSRYALIEKINNTKDIKSKTGKARTTFQLVVNITIRTAKS